MPISQAGLGAVYLARAADGIDAFDRFAASYARHPAGVAHDLIVIYKGFSDVAGLTRARDVFSGLLHRGIELDDTGFDIGSYLDASERLNHESLCFLNTHTEILADGWLAALDAQHAREGVGLVGAMGSYESLSSSVKLMERAIAAARDRRTRPTPALLRYYDFLLPRFRPDWYGAGLAADAPTRTWYHALSGLFGGRDRGGPRGTALIWPGAPELDTRAFPRFPNPHIRSNGFLISRTRLLRSDLTVMRTKSDANLFESGMNSLTAQIRRSGLAVIVAARDGAGYAIADWSQSRTFRLSDQGNLLIGDNHTRAFAGMSEGGRMAHLRMTWGDYLGPAPDDFYSFRVRFPVQPAVTRTSAFGRRPMSFPDASSPV